MSKEFRAVLTKEPIEVIEGEGNHRVVKVLEAILWGLHVELDDYPVRMCESETGGLVPVFVINEGEKLVQGVPELSIAYLSEKVAQMSQEEFDSIAIELSASKALTRINRKERG